MLNDVYCVRWKGPTTYCIIEMYYEEPIGRAVKSSQLLICKMAGEPAFLPFGSSFSPSNRVGQHL